MDGEQGGYVTAITIVVTNIYVMWFNVRKCGWLFTTVNARTIKWAVSTTSVVCLFVELKSISAKYLFVITDNVFAVSLDFNKIFHR